MATTTKVKKVPTEAAQVRKHRQRMKNRAAILSICQLTDTTFQVWGGHSPHVVRVMPNGQILCDCEGWKKARNHECSHVAKYLLVYAGGLKR